MRCSLGFYKQPLVAWDKVVEEYKRVLQGMLALKLQTPYNSRENTVLRRQPK